MNTIQLYDNSEKPLLTRQTSDEMAVPFYLSMDGADVSLSVSPFGIDMKDMLCGLFSAHGTITFEKPLQPTDGIFLCCDLCAVQSRLPNDLQLPILRQLHVPRQHSNISNPKALEIDQEFQNVLYLNVEPSVTRNIRLYLRDREGKPLSVQHCYLDCTLLTFPRRYGSR